MNHLKMCGVILCVGLFTAVCMCTLHSALKCPVGPRPRVLVITSGTGPYWQRMLAGARAAAKEQGLDLEVASPSPDNLVDQQTDIVRNINPADYAGVVFSPAAPDSQIDLINDLASRTKLVTIDRDCHHSQRLCHIGFCPTNDGALAARSVHDQLSQPGKIVLLATRSADVASNTKVSERLAGFREQWEGCEQVSSTYCTLIEAAIESNSSADRLQNLSSTLSNPEVVLIVAFDCEAAESALKAQTALSTTRHAPIVAFDPSAAILDAIDDGRVSSAVFNDPYLSGFAAIKRLGFLSHSDTNALPVPGRGNDILVSEEVRKENLADFRQRTRS